MGWFEDACDWVEGAVEDVGQAFDDAGEAIGQAASDVIDWVGDTAQNVGEAFVAGAKGVIDTAGDFIDAVGATLSNEDPGKVWEEFGMNALDNLVFDPVDYLTGGDVNLDYEDGTFTADVDLDLGIGAVGVHVGEAGFDASASFDIGIASGSISLDSSAGFAASGSLGIAGGPLPFMEGHLSVDGDGNVLIGGEIQGTLPLPGGEVSFGLDGQAEFNRDGSFGMEGGIDLSIDGPLGMSGYFQADGYFEGDPQNGEANFGGSVAAGASTGAAQVDADGGFHASIDRDRVEAIIEGGVDVRAGDLDLNAGLEATMTSLGDGPQLGVNRWADLDVSSVDGGQAGDGASDGSAVGRNQQAIDGSGDPGGDGTGARFTNVRSSVQDIDPAGLDPAGLDPAGLEPAAEMPIVEVPAFEAQDEFSQQIEAVEQIEDAADDMWDGIGQ